MGRSAEGRHRQTPLWKSDEVSWRIVANPDVIAKPVLPVRLRRALQGTKRDRLNTHRALTGQWEALFGSAAPRPFTFFSFVFFGAEEAEVRR